MCELVLLDIPSHKFKLPSGASCSICSHIRFELKNNVSCYVCVVNCNCVYFLVENHSLCVNFDNSIIRELRGNYLIYAYIATMF